MDNNKMNEEFKNYIGDLFKAREEETLRLHYEEEHEIRGKFDRDRDRILYSKAFRRLSGKTQVFLSGKDDHIRNRMTHTLEVAQIARTMSKALNLNETLTEAIALGHDLGHTPFGHVGERTLNYIMCGCDQIRDFSDCLSSERGFKHNWQGLRVVTELEKCNSHKGLNLTKYTMWGILNHSKLKYKQCKMKLDGTEVCMLRRSGMKCNQLSPVYELDFYKEYEGIITEDDITIEGLIVALADEISQRHHDVEDALEAKILGFEELYEKIEKYYGASFNNDKKIFDDIKLIKDNEVQVRKLSSFLVNLLTYNAINNISVVLENITEEYHIDSYKKFQEMKLNEIFRVCLKSRINLEDDLLESDKKFQEFVSNRILNSHKAQSMDGKGNFVIRELFKAYVTNPQQLPDKTIAKLFDNLKKYIDEYREEKYKDLGECRNELNLLHSKNDIIYKRILMRTICDYIAGMTDRYALDLYSSLYQTNNIY